MSLNTLLFNGLLCSSVLFSRPLIKPEALVLICALCESVHGSDSLCKYTGVVSEVLWKCKFVCFDLSFKLNWVDLVLKY